MQTPILGLVVRRDREHAGHRKIPYFMVHGVFRSGDFRCDSVNFYVNCGAKFYRRGTTHTGEAGVAVSF